MSEERRQSKLTTRIEKARARAPKLQERLDTRYPGAFKVVRVRNRVLIRRLTRGG